MRYSFFTLLLAFLFSASPILAQGTMGPGTLIEIEEEVEIAQEREVYCLSEKSFESATQFRVPESHTDSNHPFEFKSNIQAPEVLLHLCAFRC